MRHCSWLENGPDERLPSPSIAYQPALMPRISDLSSLMKWGMAIVVLPCAGSSVKPESNRPHRAWVRLRLARHAPEKFRTLANARGMRAPSALATTDLGLCPGDSACRGASVLPIVVRKRGLRYVAVFWAAHGKTLLAAYGTWGAVREEQ